ncbi:MAG: hypothetical protein EOM05_00230 [Clostridia bacterium]|nr:hypothetical protein [Clostridia bacterium]
MKKLISIALAGLIGISLVGCNSYSDSHTKSEKSQSTSIELEKDFESIDSIKIQTDILAQKVSADITLNNVLVSAPDGNFKSGTAYFIYYGENNGDATKVTLTIDIDNKKIIESKVQKGYPDEVGGAIKSGNLNTSANINDIINNVVDRDDFTTALASVASTYTLELDFCDNEIKVTAKENSQVFFETSLSENSI